MAKPDRKQLREIERGLRSRYAAKQTRALDAIWNLGPDAIELLAGIIRREQKQQRVLWTCTTCFVIFFLLVETWARIVDHTFFSFKGFRVVGLLLCLGLMLFDRRIIPATHFHRRIADALIDLKDVRVLGMLLELYRIRDLNRPVRDALIPLLHGLKPSDTDLLDSPQRTCLYTYLHSEDYLLRSTVLDALAQVGDAEAIPQIEKLIDRPVKNAGDEKLHARAQEILPLLRERAVKRSASDKLVRPVESTSSEQILVRPAQHAGVSEPALLVRPMMQDESVD